MLVEVQRLGGGFLVKVEGKEPITTPRLFIDRAEEEKGTWRVLYVDALLVYVYENEVYIANADALGRLGG